MSERRYNDDEVAEIFARVREKEESDVRSLTSVEGLTLTDLQQIGREAGIAPELVADAAQSLDRPKPAKPSPFLRLVPFRVARTVKLKRKLTDDEWERLVVDLRDTFDARGVLRRDGSLRQWSNGNLQVLLEPDGEGQRVRFRTMNGQARSMIAMGTGFVVVSAFTVMPLLAAAGAGVFALGLLPLRRWARTRQAQMDELAEKLLRST